MHTRHFLLSGTFFLSSIYLFAQQKPQKVTLSGKIKNLANQVQVEDMSELKNLNLPNTERIFIPDSSGEFKISFYLKESNYFRIGRNIIFLSPGDHLKMKLDYKYPKQAFFEGSNAEANNYLKNTPYPKMGSFLEGGDSIKTTISETITTVLRSAEKRKKKLDSSFKISTNFYRLESVRINADIINSFHYFLIYYPMEFNVSKDSFQAIKEEYRKIILPLTSKYQNNFINVGFLKIEVYRDVISNIIEQKQDKSPSSMDIYEWLKACKIHSKISTIDGKERILPLKNSIDSISNTKYRNELIKTFNERTRFANTDPAIDFIAINADNKKVSLSEYNGKVIYIDIWATWCGPCLLEMTHLNALKKKFINNKDIVFISLSIDDDKTVWLKKIRDQVFTGNQLLIDRIKLKPYAVSGVPRTIIIDKKFKVSALFGPLPSSEESVKILEKLSK